LLSSSTSLLSTRQLISHVTLVIHSMTYKTKVEAH
jgi:hypothetical protein